MPLADDAKRRGVHVYHLNIGQPDLETPAVMRDRLRAGRRGDRLHALGRHARVPRGAARLLRRPRASRSSVDELIATTGGSEALLFAFFAAAEPTATTRWLSSRSTRTTTRSRRWPACASCRCARTRRGRLPPAAARGLGARAHSAHEARAPLQPEQPDRHRLHAARSCVHGRRVLPRPRPLPDLGRGLPRVRLRRPRTPPRRSRSPGFEDAGGRRRQPLEALQRLRHPAGLPRDPQPRGPPGLPAHGAGATVAAGAGAARGRRR